MYERRVVRVRSYARDGRLVPRQARGLRARAVTLKPDGVMDWHSTQSHEELLIALSGRLALEIEKASGTVRQFSLTRGQCAFIPSHTKHRVVNRAKATVSYLYVTAPIR